MIHTGARPDLSFTVKALVKGVVRESTLSDLITGPTLVSVYMRNNTSACDLQTASLAEHAAGFEKLGWSVIAVSRDTCGSHAKYAAKLGIGFTLVSDPELKTAKAFDSMVEKSMYGKKYQAPERAAYLFDAGGEVVAIIPKVDAANHGPQVLAAIAALKR